MKVLVISNNCFSKTQNMGKTLGSIFSSFPREALCQLYFYASIPDGDVCGDFFRISDYDLVRGKTGATVKPQSTQALFENAGAQRAYAMVNRSHAAVKLGRTFLWDIARWNSKALRRWIADMRPDMIFFASGDTVLSYKIVHKLRRWYDLPVISYICDDFYFAKPKDLLGKCYHRMLKKWMRKVFSSSVMLATICDSLGRVYSREFATAYTVIHTGTSLQPGSGCQREKTENLAYLGNVSLNRWRSLIEIGNALAEYNSVHKTAHRLEIYSGCQEADVLEAFAQCPAICFGGRISYEKCLQVMGRSLAVIHTESMAPEDFARVKYSVSTKIADSLACGTCLFAYGSDELASIRYLKENQAAVVVERKEDLAQGLASVLNPRVRGKTVAAAQALAAKNHNEQKNSKAFYSLCCEKVDLK